MRASAGYYKEIPSGAREPMVWDRCNYSDNIRAGITSAAVLSPSLGRGMQLYLLLSFTSSCSTFYFTVPFCLLWFAPPYKPALLIFSPMQETCSFQFSVVCKVGFVPVGRKSNEGKSRCYCAAVDCGPHTPPSLLTVSPKQDRCSVCMLPAPFFIHLPCRISWLLQYLFDCSEWVPPVCSLKCPWRRHIHPQCPRLNHRILALWGSEICA